jgi:hydroxyethylthiazole kinase
MTFSQAQAAAIWEAVTTRRPLIYHLTNAVVMSEQAHIALAIGASPLMSLHPGEAEELVLIADAVVTNIGTPFAEGIAAMQAAARKARAAGKLHLLDPVGYGATKLRNDLVDEIIRIGSPTIIKGNHGEMGVLGRTGGEVRGVDAQAAGDPSQSVQTIAREHATLAIATGEVDFLSDGKRTAAVRGGHAMMTRLTGTGCWLGSVVAACAVAAGDPFDGAVVALGAYGIAAEKAAARTAQLGVGSFRLAFFDALGSLVAEDFRGFEDRIAWLNQ